MNTQIPELNIEVLSNGCIRLENTHCGDSYVVDIHPIHLRYMAEELGLVRKASTSEADGMRSALKLKRRLLVLKERIDHLGSFLCLHSDSEHADLSYEQTYATATAEICDEFCADLDEMRGVDDQVTQHHAGARGVAPDGDGSANAPSVTSALAGQKTPKNGGVQYPRKRGSSAEEKPSGNPNQTQRVSKPGQMEILA